MYRAARVATDSDRDNILYAVNVLQAKDETKVLCVCREIECWKNNGIATADGQDK